MVVEYLSSFYIIPVISQVSSYDIFMDMVRQSIQSALYPQRDWGVIAPDPPYDISLLIAKWNKVII